MDALAGGLLSFAGGVVVIRKSPRSLIRVRSPTTEIPDHVVVIRSTPLNGLGSDGKMSLRNFAVCPATASGVVTGGFPLTGAPRRSVTSNVPLAEAADVLATAMPLSIFPGRPGTPEAST